MGAVRSSDGRFSDLGRFALGIGLPRDRHPKEQALLDRLTGTLRGQLLEVRELATENDLRDLLATAASKRAGVLTLLAHNDDGALELQRESVPFGPVAQLVPTDFDGYLELLVCHSADLAKEVRWTHPRAVLFSSQAPVPLRMCIHLYTVALKMVVDRRINYMDAVVEARTAMMRRRI